MEQKGLSILYKDICNNCGKYGHTTHGCKMPITSFGVVVFRNNPETGREYFTTVHCVSILSTIITYILI